MKRIIIFLLAAAVLTVAAIGSTPRWIEEIKLGGGYSDSDGGADFEKTGIITTSGSLGVGTASPLDPLHVVADSGHDNIHLEENSGGEDWQLGVDAGGDLNFEDSGTTKITFGDGGQVGVGTETPDGDLHIHHASAGSVTAHGGADEFVIEGDTHAGMSFLTPNDRYGRIYWATQKTTTSGSFIFHIAQIVFIG